MVYLVTYFLGWLIGITIYMTNPAATLKEALLLANLVFCVGFFGIFNFIGHTILSKKVAAKIGWVSNGFQKELGLVSLGIGICGVLCYWFRDGFWLATAIPFSIFLIGAGIIHIIDIVKNKNYNPGSTWIIIPDFLMPLTILTLLIL